MIYYYIRWTKSITGNNGARLLYAAHKSVNHKKSVTWNTKFSHDDEASLKGPFIMEFDTQWTGRGAFCFPFYFPALKNWRRDESVKREWPLHEMLLQAAFFTPSDILLPSTWGFCPSSVGMKRLNAHPCFIVEPTTLHLYLSTFVIWEDPFVSCIILTFRSTFMHY